MPIDYKKYPLDWQERRKRILRRAKYKCEFCGLEHRSYVYSEIIKGKSVWFKTKEEVIKALPIPPLFEEHKFKKVKVVLTIAHLDHDVENWSVKDNRLRALCQHCHLKYDLQQKLKKRKETEKNECNIIS